MPYVSQAQEGFFHTHEKQLEAQGVNVAEWDAATKGKKLPKRAPSDRARRLAASGMISNRAAKKAYG